MRTAAFPFGVLGDCIGDWRVAAVGRLGANRCCPGVVEAGRVFVFGGGESVEERPRGLRTGMAECEETDRRVRTGVGGALLCEDGVVRDNGLKLWPITVSRRLVEMFHRGLVDAGLSEAGVEERNERVGVLDEARDGDSKREAVNDFRVMALELLMGTLEYRRVAGSEDLELVLPCRDFLPEADAPGSLPFRLIMIDDAGELFGVSMALPVNECSVRVDRTVETESRSFLLAVKSSKMVSMSWISFSRSVTFCLTSCWILRISPFNVDRFLISMSINSSTLFMEGG